MSSYGGSSGAGIGHSVWDSASPDKARTEDTTSSTADTHNNCGDVSVGKEERSEFYTSVIACIKALSNDESLTVSVGADPPDEPCDIHLPLIEDESNQSLVALIRGLADSFAMMRLHHDSQLHDRFAPQDPVADRLFTLLERERFEEVGSRQFPGVAFNLERIWALSHGAEALARFGPAEQLEFVLSCLCRETLTSHQLPQVAQRFLQPVRGPVEELLEGRISTLMQQVQDQSAFAEHSLSIIEKLGFNIAPKQQQTATGNLDGDEGSASQEEVQGAEDATDEDLDDDEVTEDETEESEHSAEVDENAELTEQAELVRNSESEPDDEPEPENLDESAIVETAAASLGRLQTSSRAASSYSVFDASADEVCKAENLLDSQKLKALRKELDLHVRNYQPMIGQLAGRLQQVLLSRQQRHWEQDLDEGELDPQRLTRVIVDPVSPLIYRVEAEAPVRDTAVCVLIDNSRSMFGKPIATAASCADLITRVLERCGVSTEVLGFTTLSMYGGAVSEHWQTMGSPLAAGRMNNVRHIVYKSAASSWQRSRDNFGLMLDKELLKQNIDGEALLWAQRRLLARPEKRRILIVISDGKPSDSYTLKANHKNYLRDHLDQVVALIEQRAAIELVAIGIGHQVSHHYSRSFHLDDVEQLGPLMLSELSRLLQR